MKRQVSLQEISDGKLYTSNDLVKADCGDCKGCHACCTKMGNSVVLDPLDVHRLSTTLGMTFEELLARYLELNVVDGIILPNLKMQGQEEQCGFLNTEGRCTVHVARPGICRLFPLGRYYEDGGFQYFLQVHECQKQNRTKVKVKKWLDTPNLKQYEQYINTWHNFLLEKEEYVISHPEEAKAVSMQILKIFYLDGFQAEAEFYKEFETKIKLF